MLWREALWREALWKGVLWKEALWKEALWKGALWKEARRRLGDSGGTRALIEASPLAARLPV